MIVKVCGLRQNDDLIAAVDAGVDYIGMIFYPASTRYAAATIDPLVVGMLSRSNPELKRIGVFVDESEEIIRSLARRFQLNAIQLHGDEEPAFCSELRNDYPVIKSISIGHANDFLKCEAYKDVCDYFLFDTAGPLKGGNGFSWDWNLLSEYHGKVPFFLSGGISPRDVNRILGIRHPFFAGVDVNSGFEISAGIKNIAAIKSFLHAIKDNENAIRG